MHLITLKRLIAWSFHQPCFVNINLQTLGKKLQIVETSRNKKNLLLLRPPPPVSGTNTNIDFTLV